jgi:hypothetical protein
VYSPELCELLEKKIFAFYRADKSPEIIKASISVSGKGIAAFFSRMGDPVLNEHMQQFEKNLTWPPAVGTTGTISTITLFKLLPLSSSSSYLSIVNELIELMQSPAIAKLSTTFASRVVQTCFLDSIVPMSSVHLIDIVLRNFPQLQGKVALVSEFLKKVAQLLPSSEYNEQALLLLKCVINGFSWSELPQEVVKEVMYNVYRLLAADLTRSSIFFLHCSRSFLSCFSQFL